MTYNVHSCVGMDGNVSPQRIARILALYDPDIVALQEVDVNRSRTGGIDQAQQIAELLNMEYHFHPSFTIAEEHPVIVCADLNVSPMSGIYHDMRQVLHDTSQFLDKQVNIPTWMGMTTVDYIFASSEWGVLDRRVPRTYLTRSASDHLPVIVDLSLP